ncbi:MAG: hypothetical protein DME25_07300 [Verrucomicrobia bacterium]|nr:MAG: hypothetical protein DME25_07300 [Verrucomicrobiota bacterium]
MKTQSGRFYLVMVSAGLLWLGGTMPPKAFGAEEDRPLPAQRLERLERRINELAERQEQMLRRLGAAGEHQPPMPGPGQERVPHPMRPDGAPGPAPAKVLQDLGGMVKLLFLIGILCNILLTIWIFTDIRKRGEGSGIFVALALVAGIPAALLYALVRIGDKKP